MTYLLFAVALSLSAVAAWYAIAGLMAIFAAAAIPIAIMGSLLEAAKLVTASWLYRNWVEIPKLFKVYFVTAVVILMMLTSMGIFGFLSKAHLDQAVPTGEAIAKLEIIDDKINTQKENIDVARRTISQLDRQVEETLNRTADATNNAAVNRSIAIRRQQANEREALAKAIEEAQTEISKLTQERIPLAQEVRKIEAEVGPIKYIAALIYGESSDAATLESAVRFVTLLIVFVFDPMAVLLLVAANWQLKQSQNKKKPSIEDFVPQPKTLVTHKEINLSDNVSVQDDRIIKEQFFHETEDSELPEIEVEEHSKEWEPEIYQRAEPKKTVGRLMEETGKPPPKVQSFLSKVQSMFTIEREVEDLQKRKK
jgi:hypothetical protein